MEDSFTQLNEKIESFQLVAHRKERILKHILRNSALLDGMKMDLKALHKSLDKEERDVLILQERNLNSLFHQVLGSYEKQLEIERQEYLMELLKFNELVETIKIKEYEISILEGTLAGLKDDTKLGAKLLKKKEKLLKESDKKFAIKITLLDHEIEKLLKKIELANEAIEEGKKSTFLLDKIRAGLVKVENWGSWKYAGKGRNSVYAKKTFIDQARANALAANSIIEKLEYSLSEIFDDLQIPDKFRLDHFEQFLNTFYENLITDWIIQRSIKNAHSNIQMTRDKVTRLIATVENKNQKLQDEILRFKDQRTKLIINN